MDLKVFRLRVRNQSRTDPGCIQQLNQSANARTRSEYHQKYPPLDLKKNRRTRPRRRGRTLDFALKSDLKAGSWDYR